MPNALDLIALIYEAVTDPPLWKNVLDSLVESTRGIGGSLLVGEPNFDDYAFIYRYAMTEEEVALYLEKYAVSDAWAHSVRFLPEGYVGASHDIWPEEEMVKSPAYQGFYGPRNWHYGIGGVFFRTPATVSLITSIREKEKGPYGEQELGLLRTLVPHLRRAALLHSELNSLRSQHAAFASQLDRSPQALLLTDADRRILFTNAPGRAITKVKDGLRVELNQLRASSSTEDATLAKSIREVAANGKWRVDHLTVARPSGGTPYVVLVMPVPSFGAPLGMPPPAVAVMVTDPDRPVSLDPKALQVLFSFTPAEAKVTALLVQGRSMEQIATQLAVSLETVRTHVRHVFSKTATNRQGELIALVLRMAPSGPESADDSSKMCI